MSALLDSPVFTDPWNRPQREAEEALRDHWCVVLIGGNRSGKTHGGMRIATKAILGAYDWCPEPASVATVSIAKNQAEGALQTKIEEFFLTLPDGIITGRTTRENLTSPIKLSNGSRYTVKTDAQGWKAFQGAEYNLVHFDECPTKKVWKEMAARIKPGAPLKRLVTMTPTESRNWFWDELLDKAEERGVKIISAPVFTNGVGPCLTCGKTEEEWDPELATLALSRTFRHHWDLKELCHVCHTFGVEPRIQHDEVRQWEEEFVGAELGIRLYGEIENARGDRVFKPAEVRALQQGALNATYVGETSRWEDPEPGTPYVGGMDAAEGLGGDHSESICTLLNAATGCQVALWGDNTTPYHEYESTVQELVMEYNPCELVIESASQGKTMLESFRFSSINLYRQRNDGSALSETTGRLGWWSAGSRRDHMLRNLIRAIRHRLVYPKDGPVYFDKENCPAGSVTVRDMKTIAQLAKLRYNRERNNKIDVPDEGKDDRVLALGMAHEARVGKHWVPWTVPKNAKDELDPYTLAVLETYRARVEAQSHIHPDLQDY